MKYRVPDNADLLKQVPSDLSLESCGRDDFVIRHVRTGMGCLNAFAIVCLAGWMVGCVSLLRDYFRGGQMEDGGPIPIWFVLLFWGLEIAVAVLLLNVLFRKKTFPVKKGKLIIETDLLGPSEVTLVQVRFLSWANHYEPPSFPGGLSFLPRRVGRFLRNGHLP